MTERKGERARERKRERPTERDEREPDDERGGGQCERGRDQERNRRRDSE